MRQSIVVYGLSAAAIEFAHDFGIETAWPGLEPVEHGTCRDLNLLHSAAAQPFQECFGIELYPTLEAKAAYLFYHLTTSHVFGNGNKRTAVLCLDAFLLLNARLLMLDNREIYDLARSVASSGADGRTFNETFHDLRRLLMRSTVPFAAFRATDESLYRWYHKLKWELRNAAYNQPGAKLRQRELL